MKKHRERVKVNYVRRTKEYYGLRYHWLHELRWLRAKRRAGTASTKDIKAAQRALSRVWKEERL